MPLYLDTGPAETPVTLAEAKLHLRVTESDQDALILSLIKAATAHAEQITGRAFVSQTWVKTLDAFPASGGISLKAPVASIAEIRFTDPNGAEQALDPAHYQLDPYTLPGWVLPAYGYDWPETRANINAVKVKFVCGFGNAASVPEDIKAALLLLIGHLYENREATSDRAITDVPFTVDALLAPYRILNIV